MNSIIPIPAFAGMTLEDFPRTDSLNFRTLDLRKIVMATYYFRNQVRHGKKEALRALQFRCDRGVKHFSQRSQRLRSVRNVCPDRRKEPKPVFSSINGIAMVGLEPAPTY
jgi:hypothetical protein